MKRWLWVTMVLCVACGDDSPAVDCADVEAPVIECPETMDLGCIDPAGQTVRFSADASGCGTGRPEVTCTPESGFTASSGTQVVTCTARNEAGEASCSFEVRATGGATLTCSPDIAEECTGPGTTIVVPAPRVDDTCGELGGEVSSDAPDAFAFGDTDVVFSTPSGASCSLRVQVRDTAPPTLDCPATSVVVRGSRRAVALAPEVAVSDVCDSTVASVAEPLELDPGVQDVLYTATDAAGLSASCVSSVEVLSAYAPHSERLISAQLRGDGSTDITLAWDASGGADLTGYAIDSGPTPEGPWTRVDSVGRGRRTYTIGRVSEPLTYYRIVALASEFDGGAGVAIPARAIASAQYDVRDQSVSGIPFDTTLYGVVRHPVDLSGGPYPLVLLLHGNHGICRRTPTSDQDSCARSENHECPQAGFVTTPNAEGLAYLAETVAAQGYVAVSLSGNAVNCRDNFIPERAALIRAHMERWTRYGGAGATPFGDTFAGAVDLNRIALFGHSRGGEAVAVVPGLLDASPVAGATLVSVFSLAPTDFEEAAPGGVAYGVLLPGCDGDVRFLFGTDIYDRSIREDDEFARAQLLFPGANHNFFSTEWRLNDNNGSVCNRSDEVGAPAQRAAMEGVFGSWLAATVGGVDVEAFMRAESPVPEGIDAWADTRLDWRWSHHTNRAPVDELEGAGTPSTNLLGAANTFTGFDTASQCFDNDCGNRYPHEKGAMLLSWDGGTPLATWGLGGFDAGAWPYVSFRVVSRRSTFNSGSSEQSFVIRLVDSAGDAAEVDLGDWALVPHLYPASDPLEIFQTVRVPLTEFPVDVTNLEQLEFEMSTPGYQTGSVLVSDVALSR